uniref:Uncharacterized protein n=1 Tax=Arundo donax TaxID=35708 RepID=A0A0A9FAE9_ARUDO
MVKKTGNGIHKSQVAKVCFN